MPVDQTTNASAFDPEYFTPGLTGLQRTDNSCYMNTIIQCLSNIVEMRTRFIARYDTMPTVDFTFSAFRIRSFQ